MLTVIDLHHSFGEITALAGRIYAGALTRGGARLTLRAALRLNAAPRRRVPMRSGD